MTAKKTTGEAKLGTEERRKQAAEKTGQKVGVVKLQLDELRKKGMCISVSVTGKSIGVTRAALADFGITDTDIRTKRYTAGVKVMFEKETYEGWLAVESSYRQSLKRLTVDDVPGIAPWLYITYEAFDDWRKKAEVIEERAKEIVDGLLDTWDAQRRRWLKDERAAASNAWDSLDQAGFGGIRIGGVDYTDREAFVERMVRASAAKFPSRNRIEETMRLSYRTAVVATVGDLEADRVELDRLRAERDAMTDKAKAIYDAEKERRIAELEAARRPLDEIAAQVRGTVSDAVAKMLEGVKKNGYWHGKSTEQLDNLMKLVRAVSVGEDKDLNEQLARLSALTKQSSGKSAAVANALETQLERVLEIASAEPEGLDVGVRDDRADALEF